MVHSPKPTSTTYKMGLDDSEANYIRTSRTIGGVDDFMDAITAVDGVLQAGVSTIPSESYIKYTVLHRVDVPLTHSRVREVVEEKIKEIKNHVNAVLESA